MDDNELIAILDSSNTSLHSAEISLHKIHEVRFKSLLRLYAAKPLPGEFLVGKLLYLNILKGTNYVDVAFMKGVLLEQKHPQLKKYIAHKNRLFKRAIYSPPESQHAAWLDYKKVRNKVQASIRSEKITFYRKQLIKDPSTFYRKQAKEV